MPTTDLTEALAQARAQAARASLEVLFESLPPDTTLGDIFDADEAVLDTVRSLTIGDIQLVKGKRKKRRKSKKVAKKVNKKASKKAPKKTSKKTSKKSSKKSSKKTPKEPPETTLEMDVIVNYLEGAETATIDEIAEELDLNRDEVSEAVVALVESKTLVAAGGRGKTRKFALVREEEETA